MSARAAGAGAGATGRRTVRRWWRCAASTRCSPTARVALANLDLAIGRHEFVSLLGPSGCGKSTALRLIAGLGRVSRGRIEWPHGEGLGDIGFVFQEPTLMPWATVADNVWLPLRLQGRPRRRRVAESRGGAGRWSGLDGFARAYPRELSGGMKMRVSIARALVTRPKLLLMDEPFAALDEITRFKLNNDLLRLWQGQSWTVVFVTHSVFESVYLSNRVVVMAARPGRVVAEIPIDAPLPPRRGVPDLGRLQRVLPRGLGRAAPRDGRVSGMSAVRPADGPATRAARAAAADEAGFERWFRWLAPLTLAGLAILAWDLVVRVNAIPPYILPGPGLVLSSLVNDWATLWPSLLVTLKITFLALAAAIVGGVGLAVLFSLSRWIELSLFPFAVILQVTPIVAIAPLILIYVDNTYVALLLCAWIVAFFPILSNTTLGLNSADHNLRDLFQLYRASRWQQLRLLRLPSAMPYFLGGLRIAGGLSLIGAIVAEFAAGTAGTGSGLAYRILEAGYRLNIPRMFAALILISLTGIVIFLAFTLLQHLVLRRWHESALKRGALSRGCPCLRRPHRAAQPAQRAVGDAQLVEMGRGVEQIVGAGAERPAGRGDRVHDRGLVEAPGVALVRVVDQEGDRPARASRGVCATTQPGRYAAGHHLAPPDDLELVCDLVRGDPVEHATAGPAAVQPQHQAWLRRRAAAEAGPQAEAAMMAVDRGDLAAGEVESRVPDQGAVAEQRQILAGRVAGQDRPRATAAARPR